MPKVAMAGEHHGDFEAVARADDFLIADGAAGLDNGFDSRAMRDFNIVSHGEKSVTGQTRAFRARAAGLLAGDFHRVDAAHLSRADSNRSRAFDQHNRVGTHQLGALPGEQERF